MAKRAKKLAVGLQLPTLPVTHQSLWPASSRTGKPTSASEQAEQDEENAFEVEDAADYLAEQEEFSEADLEQMMSAGSELGLFS